MLKHSQTSNIFSANKKAKKNLNKTFLSFIASLHKPADCNQECKTQPMTGASVSRITTLCNAAVSLKYFKNTSEWVASVSWWLCVFLALMLRHRPRFIQHPIINLCEQERPAARQPATSCPICPSLTRSRPQSFSLISIIHEGPLAFPHSAASPYKGVQRYKAARCQYLVMLRIAIAQSALHSSHGRGEACHDITQIFLKL